MTRPFALIEGDLTIPLPRPYDGLPPPFGVRRNLLREAVNQAVEKSVRPAQPFGMLPPGVKHILLYKLPQRKVDTYNVDAALAEAKRYLEMGTVRPRSSRSDRVLAASIFAACTIALTWLLVTCSMKDAENAKAVSVAHPPLVADSSRGDHQPKLVARTAEANAPTEIAAEKTMSRPAETAASSVASPAPVASETPAVASSPRVVQPLLVAPAVPKQVAPVESRQIAQAAPAPVASKRVHVARLSEAQANRRVTLSQATHPAARPAVSAQPEWNTGASRSNADASVDAPWLNWAAQQHTPSPAARMTTPIDNSWNDHMTQRRITDDPSAFHVDRGGQ